MADAQSPRRVGCFPLDSIGAGEKWAENARKALEVYLYAGLRKGPRRSTPPRTVRRSSTSSRATAPDIVASYTYAPFFGPPDTTALAASRVRPLDPRRGGAVATW